jgi:hypothetical protein
MLEEPPMRAGFIADAALDEGVCHLIRSTQQRVDSLLVGAVLGGVEQHVPHASGAAAATVVVPEPGPEPSWDAGGQDRVQASLPQPLHLETGYLVHAGVRQRREQVRGADRSVAPGIRHRLHVALGGRDGVRNDEAIVVQRAHAEQVLRALPRGSD